MTDHLIPAQIIKGRVYHVPKGRPYAHGSTLEAVLYAQRKGYKGIDVDYRTNGEGHGYWCHQPNPTRRDAWFDPKGLIGDGHPILKLTDEQCDRLTYKSPSGDKFTMMNDERFLRACKAAGLVPCVEDKTFTGQSVEHWRKFKALADGIGVVPIVMSLPGSKSVPGARKLKTAHDAGLVTMWLWRPGSKVPDFVDLVKSHLGRPIYRVSDRPISAAANPRPTVPAPKPPAPKPPAPKNSDVIDLGRDTSGRPLRLERRTLDKIRAAEARLDVHLTIVQGSFSHAAASADTHGKAGAADIRSWDLPARLSPQEAVKVLRQCGLVAWYRTKAQGFDPHIHCIDRGNPRMSSAAKAQVTDWKRGRNGLASHGKDDGWRGRIPFFAPKVNKPPAAPKPKRTVVDYSFARPSPAALKDAGFTMAVRYISNGSKKDINRDEAQALRRAGLDVALVWETGAARAGEGRAAGAADAKAAEAAADRLGYPKGAVIFYAVDFDATPDRVRPYFAGVKANARRPVGVYGGFRIADAGFADHVWQTAAWSGGRVSAKADLFQHADKIKRVHGSAPGSWDENTLHRTFPVWKH